MPVPTLYRWAQTPEGHVGFTTVFDFPADQLVQVAGTGAAFLLIHRTALEKVRAEYGDVWFDQVRYGDGRLVSEDLSFCWRLHSQSIPVHVHTGVKTTHHKQFWVGNDDYAPPAALLQAVRAAEVAGFEGPDRAPVTAANRETIAAGVLPMPTVVRQPAQPGQMTLIQYDGSPKISILCPTRGRPASMRRLVESCDLNAVAMPEIVFYLDEDDTESIDCAKELHAARGGGIVALVGPRIVLSEMWNRCAEVASADIMMHCGDDIVFRTPRWDQLVVEAFDRYPDKLVFVHGDDKLQGSRLGTHGFLHRRWVETVGYFVPPYFSSDWNDVWLTEVADALARRVYLPELVTEHLHPLAGKAGWDVTHRERLQRGADDQVGELYQSLAAERGIDVMALRTVIEAGA